MSHELRTPLNSILGFSEILLAAENLTEKQHRYSGNIRDSGQLLAQRHQRHPRPRETRSREDAASPRSRKPGGDC
ncbi:MAG: histidine kinase dimerization/phospho-acceptor domain-containing protein [Gemmataceae bacterium]